MLISTPVFINSEALLERTCEFMASKFYQPILVVVNRCDEPYRKELKEWSQTTGCFLYWNGVNSVASAWNVAVGQAILSGEDSVCCMNFDVQADAVTILALQKACRAEPLEIFGPIVAESDETVGVSYCCWGASTKLFHYWKSRELDSQEPFPGRFDENFYGAYYEDIDGETRLSRIGIIGKRINTKVTHEGSQTILLTDEATAAEIKYAQFLRNRKYFVKKYGYYPDG